jgi:predicted RNA methylase
MPSEALDWITRVGAVEREYKMVRLAMDRLRQQAMNAPHILTGDQRFRDIDATADRLEGTYIVRVFSEFETALKQFLRAKKLKVPSKAESLINKVRDKVDISTDHADNVHQVRDYRNALVHDRVRPVVPVTMRDSTRRLNTFLSWLQRTW